MWSVVGAEPVASTAGTFPACYLVSEFVAMGQGNFFGHWLCPGVGFARHEHVFCGNGYGGSTVFDLIDYTIPPLVAVE